MAEVVDLPTTGVNTERIWYMEHFADWLAVNLGQKGTYHRAGEFSASMVDDLPTGRRHRVPLNDAAGAVAGAEASAAPTADAGATADGAPDDANDAASAEAKAKMEAAELHDIEISGEDDQSRPFGPEVDSGSGESGNDAPVDEQTASADDAADSSAAAGGEASAAKGNPAAQRTPSGRMVRRMKPGTDASLDDNGTPREHAGRVARKVLPTVTDSVDSGSYGHDTRENHLHTGKYHGVTVRQVHERLDAIEYKQPLYSPAFAGLAAAIACASFVFLLGGGLYDMLAAFIGAGIGQFLRAHLMRRHINQFFVVMVSVALAALISIGFLRALAFFDPSALHHDTAYIGAILFVIPGFPLITGGLDIFKMDIQSGIQRMTYFLAIVLVATLSAWAVARCVSLDPQGFDTPAMNDWVRMLLRLVTAFGGVWGFSVLFNSPQKMCCVAGCIGAIADTARLELVDWGLPMEGGAFVGALIAGLLATGWRSSVRHGLLAPELGFPRICLTVPSIVIMVPGLYMYRAVFYLGELDTQATVQWAFEAMLVILMLPIGLAVARVLTDRGWRYDV